MGFARAKSEIDTTNAERKLLKERAKRIAEEKDESDERQLALLKTLKIFYVQRKTPR